MAREVLQQHNSARDYDRAAEEEREREELRWPGKRATTDEHSSTAGEERGHDMGRLRQSLMTMEGAGTSLPSSVSSQFGGLLGADLSSIRLHTAGPAAQQAQSMGAQAFTHGSHIAFAPGQFSPESSSGRHILAHEIIHVVQNQRSGGQMQLAARMDVGPSGSDVETEAEHGALALTSGRAFNVSSRAALPGISMFSGSDPTPAPQPGPAPTPAQTGTPAPTGATPAPTPGAAPTPTPAPGPTPTAAPTGAAPKPAPAPTPAPTGTPAPGGAGPTSAGPAPAGTSTPGPSPGPKPSPTPSPAPSSEQIDGKVKQVLEQRADPGSKAQYAKAISQVNVLRIQALGYTFTNQNIGNTLFQALVCPTEAISDHWGQIYSNNAYRGNQGAGFNADTLQASIEGLRGVLHILGDVSAMISGWAGMVAMVSGLLALITSETIIGGLGFGAIAAAADSVAIITGLIKLMCDVIDMVLGIVQIVILIIRARSTKDPAARARFAALLKKESGDLAANVTSVAMQVVVMVATAGAGTAVKKAAGVEASFGKELKSLISPAKVFEGGLGETLSKFKYAEQPLGKNIATGGRRLLGAEVGEEATVGVSRLKRVSGRVTKAREVLKFEPSEYKAIAKNQMKGAKLVQLNSMMAYISGKGVTQTVATVGTAQLVVITRAPSGPSTPSGEGGVPRIPDKPQGALTTVNMWPSQLEAFKTAKAPLAAAKERTEEQYNAAKEQAGEELAAEVDAKLKQVLDESTKQTATAGSVTTDANEGKANSDKGADQAAQGKDKKAQADGTNSKIQTEGSKASGQADQMHPPPPKDGVLGWIYNHTIGKIGEAIGAVQNWIRNMVGKLVMSAAGFSKEELDMAGVENDMRTSSKQDTQAQQDAAQTASQAAPLQQKVYELQKDKTTSQQQAIQGMADAQSFLKALEEAETGLDQAIESGGAYIETVTPIIRHELETQVAEKKIDAAYLAPILGYADAFTGSLAEDGTGAQAQAQADAVFDMMKATFSSINVTSGKSEVTAAVGQYNSAYTALQSKAQGEAAKVKAAVSAFNGTNDYDGVNANAGALDKLAADFDKDANELADNLYKVINGILASYEQQINEAIAKANATPDDGSNPDGGNPDDPGSSSTTPAGPTPGPGQSSPTNQTPNASPGPTPTPNATPGPTPTPNATPNPQQGPTATPGQPPT
jgi:hypothetical protein